MGVVGGITAPDDPVSSGMFPVAVGRRQNNAFSLIRIG